MKVVATPATDDAEQYNGTDTTNLNALLGAQHTLVNDEDGTLLLALAATEPPSVIAPINATDWVVRAHTSGTCTVIDNATFTATYTEATRAEGIA